MRIATTKLSAIDVKERAQDMGLRWTDITGLVVQRFEDGSALFVLAEAGHADAHRLVDLLLEQGLAERG